MSLKKYFIKRLEKVESYRITREGCAADFSKEKITVGTGD